MEAKEFEEFLAKIKRGKYPPTMGCDLSSQQFEQVKKVFDDLKELMEKTRARIDYYFETSIETRLNRNL